MHTHEILAAWIVGGFLMATRANDTGKKFHGMTPSLFWGVVIIVFMTVTAVMP